MSRIVIQKNVPLAPLTTIGVGGNAKYFIEVKSEDEAREALQFARGKDLPVFVLGGGSNIIVNDEGFPGLVIYNKIPGFESLPAQAGEAAGGKVKIRVGAGEDWDETVRRTVEAGWAGLENLSGIPGTVGAAPVQNIGAYGASVDGVLTEVRGIDTETLKERTLNNKECEFAYRDSIFKRRPGKFFITGATFELVPGGVADASAYPDVQLYFRDKLEPPTIAEMRRAIIEIRSRKGMVILPGYEKFQSAGSFFKNPVVAREAVERIEVSCSNPWFWEGKDGKAKISAACLIEQSGFPRGYADGKVGISPKQPLALINLGGASACEVAAFAEKIKAAVKDKFGIELEEETQFVG